MENNNSNKFYVYQLRVEDEDRSRRQVSDIIKGKAWKNLYKKYMENNYG